MCEHIEALKNVISICEGFSKGKSTVGTNL